MQRLLWTRLFVAVVCFLSAGTLFYVYLFPPPSMFVSRAGVPHFTPLVLNPVTGKGIRLETLVSHYKGE